MASGWEEQGCGQLQTDPAAMLLGLRARGLTQGPSTWTGWEGSPKGLCRDSSVCECLQGPYGVDRPERMDLRCGFFIKLNFSQSSLLHKAEELLFLQCWFLSNLVFRSHLHGSYTTLPVESLKDHPLSLSVEFLYSFHPFLHRRESPSTLSSFYYALILHFKAFLTYCPRIASSNFCLLISVHFLYLPIASFFHLHLIQRIFLFSNLNIFLLFSAYSAPQLCLANNLHHVIFFLFFPHTLLSTDNIMHYNGVQNSGTTKSLDVLSSSSFIP